MLQVYLASVEGLYEESNFLKKLDSVTENRRSKVKACKNQGDKVRSLGAGLLLQYALKQVQISEYVIKTHKMGKPYLEGNTNIYFNLSHSGKYVLCGISDKEIGVDIQNKKDIDNARKLANRFFMDEEIQLIESAEEEKQLDIFIRIWAVKESYLKYNGQGLSFGLDSFQVKLEEGLILNKNKDVVANFLESMQANNQIAICQKEIVKKDELETIKINLI